MRRSVENSAQWSRELRLAWIERAAKARGTIRRMDIVTAFSIGDVVASQDFRDLLQPHPQSLSYDTRSRCYRWTGGERLVTEIPYPVTELIID